MLTSKQERFCQEIVKGIPQNEAYLKCYNVGATTKRATVYRRAAEMFENGKIRARVEELRKPVIEKAQRTLQNILEDIERIKLANIGEDDRIALDCLKHEAKLRGFEINKSDITSKGETITMPSIEINGKKQKIKMGKSNEQETV